MKLRIVKHTNPVSNISSYVIERRYLGLFWVGVDCMGDSFFTVFGPYHYGDLKSAIDRAYYLAKEWRLRRNPKQPERQVVAVID